ncbi:hypothetical protein SAMN05414139_02262 [Burkholderia sp. D7]|nr:hypothetical protein SAMN05414139_02262 [Burkholderia sp. D7]
MDTRPPIPRRDSGSRFSINNPDDGTPIKEMFKVGDGLLLITEKCAYRMQVADQIDPDRKNPSLPPNFQQKIFDHGTASDLICRTLLQANVMFRKEFQPIDNDHAMQLAFDAFSDIVSTHEAAQVFVSAEKAGIEYGRHSNEASLNKKLAKPLILADMRRFSAAKTNGVLARTPCYI